MRHRVAYRKLGRVTEHRLAMLRNQSMALLRHEHLTTTVPRAKELRPFVERLITIAKRGVAEGATSVKALNARRLVLQDLQDREVVRKLFETIAPRFADRPGGYTRLLRLGFRRGDAAEVAQVELLGSEFNPRAKAAEGPKAEAAAPQPKGVGGRLRAAADRLRGKKAEPAAGAEPKETSTRSGSKKSSAKNAGKTRKTGKAGKTGKSKND
jgi:large subunit ribosomal protein L17